MAGNSDESRQGGWIKAVIGFIVGIVAGAIGNILSQPAESVKQTILFQLINSIPYSYLVIPGLIILLVGVTIFLKSLLSRHTIAPMTWKKVLPWIGVCVVGLLVGAPLMSYGPAIWHGIFPPDSGIHTSLIEGELVGISDGHDVFDTHRLDHEYKDEAAKDVREGKIALAKSYWDWANRDDTADAEAKIYLEDECILGIKLPQMLDDQCSRKTFITVVVAAPLSGDLQTINMGRDILQGAYVAQREFNDLHPEEPQLYLLIANIGSAAIQADAQPQVANQIIRVAQTDPTFISVIGLPFGSENLMTLLNVAHIPMISIAPLATDEISYMPYLRSVAPSFRDEAKAALKYITDLYPIGHVAVVHASDDPYSQKLTNAFVHSFDSDRIIDIPYAGGSEDSLNDASRTVLTGNADIVYFAGSYEDARVLQIKLRRLHKQIPILGGDTIYQWVHAPSQETESFIGLIFVAFAFPDMWSIQGVPANKFPFYNPTNASESARTPSMILDYRQIFDPDHSHSNQYYSLYTYGRADGSVILSYDSLALLLQAACRSLGNKCDAGGYSGYKISSDAIMQAIPQIFQSISGQISYSEASNAPQQKAVLILSIGKQGIRCLQIAGGRYQVGTSS